MVVAAASFDRIVTLSWIGNSNNETGFFIERAIGSRPFAQIAQVGANVELHQYRLEQ